MSHKLHFLVVVCLFKLTNAQICIYNVHVDFYITEQLNLKTQTENQARLYVRKISFFNNTKKWKRERDRKRENVWGMDRSWCKNKGDWDNRGEEEQVRESQTVFWLTLPGLCRFFTYRINSDPALVCVC